MKRFVKYLLLAFIMVTFLSSCLTKDIREQEISRIEINLTSTFYNITDSVPPGSRCRLQVTVYDSKGEEIMRPDHRNLIVTSSNDTFTVVRQNQNVVILDADSNGFRMIEEGMFRFMVAIEENPFKSEEYEWGIDWFSLDRVNYSGMDGTDGRDGQDGRDGYGSSSFTLDGGDGSDGDDGGDGYRGPDITLVAAYYDISDMVWAKRGEERMLILFNPKTGDTFLSALNSVTIDVSGGNGGKGGDGGDAGEAGEYTESGSTTGFGKTIEGDDGEPGDGADGGNGAAGGTIKLIYYSDSILDYIDYDISGGEPGKGGEPGDSAGFGTASFTKRGRDGNFGGSKGEFSKVRLSFDEAKEMLKEIDNEYFNIDRVVEE